jgi:hypothetical protein
VLGAENVIPVRVREDDGANLGAAELADERDRLFTQDPRVHETGVAGETKAPAL